MSSFPFTVAALEGALPEPGLPLRVGIPCPQGLASSSLALLLDIPGKPSQQFPFSVLDRWADGTPRWIQAWVPAPEGHAGTLRLAEATDGRGEAPADPGLTCTEGGEGLRLETGVLSIVLGPGADSPFRELRPTSDASGEAWWTTRLTAGGGQPAAATVERVWAERVTAAAALVRATGLLAVGSRTLEVDWEITAFAGRAFVEVSITLRNTSPARHAGGFWELGDPGSVLLRFVEFQVGTSLAAGYRSAQVTERPGSPVEDVPLPFELYQDSSGGERWNCSTHVNREGRVPARFQGYRRSDRPDTEGLRATPLVVAGTGTEAVALATSRFWQECPKAITVDAAGITYGLFPYQYDDLHELQGGEQKTHTFAVGFGSASATLAQLASWQARPIVVLDPEAVCATGAVPGLIPEHLDPSPGYVALVRQVIDGPHCWLAKRERIDEYGWRHFGDVYGDHEAVFHDGPTPLVSHCNNQYDPVLGLALHFLRSGTPTWMELCDDLARHVVDIDIYHTDGDKSAYNHGLFWHTAHYIDVGKATHRTYPRADGAPSGGPASEHNYTSGLLLHYFLTGCPRSREACLELAQFVIDIDDGSKTIFRWLSRGPTGLASCSRSPDYHGPGRGPANSVNALLDGYRLTGQRRFLDKAEELIRRVIHPEDDIAALDLLDAENRWFYTMFLQTLVKYLATKEELGQLDEMYAYGRASLLHYARWMAEHERPYLEAPEQLEYPTETWIAQDMRKADVMWAAARYAPPPDHEFLLDRVGWFFTYVVHTLRHDTRRHLTRPVAVLLTVGVARQPAPAPPTHGPGRAQPFEGPWPPRAGFRPQRARALARARALVIAAGAVGLVGAVLATLLTLVGL